LTNFRYLLSYSQRALSVDGCPLIIFKEASVLKESEKYNPPDSAIEALARCLLPAIRSYFEGEEGQREFAEWQARRGAEQTQGEVMPGQSTGRAA
jgi:hypothetical protein